MPPASQSNIGLQKAYLRYESGPSFASITSCNANNDTIVLSGCSKFLFSASNESIICWSLRRNEEVIALRCNRNGTNGNGSTSGSTGSMSNSSVVTKLQWLSVGEVLIAGYSDGAICLWEFKTIGEQQVINNTNSNSDTTMIDNDSSSQTVHDASNSYKYFDFDCFKPPTLALTLNGHRGEVSAITAAAETGKISSQYVASGGNDTDIVIWDVLSETGICRLRGHRDRVTAVEFLNLNEDSDLLLSCSKDKTLRLWSVSAQVCYQTIIEPSELWSMCYIPRNTSLQKTKGVNKDLTSESDSSRLLVGSSDSFLRVYSIKDVVTKPSNTNKGKSSTVSESINSSFVTELIQSVGHIQRDITNSAIMGMTRGFCKASTLNSNDDSDATTVSDLTNSTQTSEEVLICHGNSKALEVFRIHNFDEAKKKMKRRQKRANEKANKIRIQKEKMKENLKSLNNNKNGSKRQKKDLTEAAKKSESCNMGFEDVESDSEADKDEEDDIDDDNVDLDMNDNEDENNAEKDPESSSGFRATDEFSKLPPHRTKARIHGLAYSSANSRCVLGLACNSLEVIDLTIKIPNLNQQVQNGTNLNQQLQQLPQLSVSSDPSGLKSIERHGHRNMIRSLAVSSDDGMIMSTSAESIKIWNARTQQCVKTLSHNNVSNQQNTANSANNNNIGYGLCGFFAPGNEHVVIGTKSGGVELYNLQSGELQQSEGLVHQREIYAISPSANELYFATGGADKMVRFHTWKEMTGTTDENDINNKTSYKTLAFVTSQDRQIETSDDVMCLSFSKDGKWIVVGLLDHTASLYFEDSLKFNLSFYGHNLPLFCLDFSSDSQLLATGSADKNLKLWSPVFGNCFKSIRAHEDSIMHCKFVKQTHYLVTVSKDKSLKTWDCDSYELISTLGYHYGEIWGLALSLDGAFIVTGGGDRSIRMWNRTDQQFWLSEERDKELEQQMESEALRGDDTHAGGGGLAATSGVVVNSVRATRATLETLNTTDRLIELIDNSENDVRIGIVKCRETHILKGINRLSSGSIYEVLLGLPFAYAIDILKIIAGALELYNQNITSSSNTTVTESSESPASNSNSESTTSRTSASTSSSTNKFITLAPITEMTVRTALILLFMHSKRLGSASDASFIPLLCALRSRLRDFIQSERTRIGVCNSAMTWLAQDLAERRTVRIESINDKSKSGSSDKIKAGVGNLMPVLDPNGGGSKKKSKSKNSVKKKIINKA